MLNREHRDFQALHKAAQASPQTCLPAYGREAVTHVQGFGLKVVALTLCSLKLPATRLSRAATPKQGGNMNPTLEAIVDGAMVPDPELDECIAQMEPVILALKQRGIQANTIIAALAQLTVITVRGERLR